MKNYVSLLVLLALLAVDDGLRGQGTAFTYQGQLQNDGGPATGNYDFTFSLYNNSGTNTGQVGSTLTILDVGVTNGLFVATLDFGANFPGSSRWLSIGVRTNGSASFTALSPLQELTPAPYAIYTANSGTAANFTGLIALSQLPLAVVTNNAVDATLSNATLTGTLDLSSNVIINAGTNLFLASDAHSNLFAGPGAGNLSTGSAGGAYNTVFGTQTLTSNISGVGNSAFGLFALGYNTAGSANTAYGYGALYGNTNGGFNSAYGALALDDNGSGSNNIAMGFLSMAGNTSGSQNAAVGVSSMSSFYAGSNNVAAGYNALGSIGTADNNTAIGYNALGNLGEFISQLEPCGSNNIGIGAQAGINLTTTESNDIYIGNQGFTGESGTIRIGTEGVHTNIVFAGVINGSGGNLTTLNASQLTSGTIPNSVLAGFQSGNKYSAVASGQNNTVSGSTDSAIAGGTNNVLTNVTASAIVGGMNNTNNGNQSTIGGGAGNLIQIGAYYAFLGSGGGNVIQSNSDTSVLGGGYHNFIGTNASGTFLGSGQYNSISNNANWAFLGGGYQNTNTGPYSVIPGGENNVATSYSFAAGSNALATNTSAFVWSDGSAATGSTNANSVTFRASGGYRFFTGTGAGGAYLAANQTSWTTLSDRNAKKNFQPVDTKAVLDKLAAIPIQQWNYK
jgi:hypothetical protein